MLDWLKKVGGFFKMLFSPETAEKITNGVKLAAPYVSLAMALAAELGGANKTVGTVLDFAKKYGLPVVFAEVQNATPAELGNVARGLVRNVLATKFPGLSDSVLNLAIELAVNALKQK